jgi:hypothetical protein
MELVKTDNGHNMRQKYIIIKIIIIRKQLDLDRPVSASSVGLFKGLPSRLTPFVLQFSIIFAILLPFILVTCRGQFGAYFLIFFVNTKYKKIYISLIFGRLQRSDSNKQFRRHAIKMYYRAKSII